ncbi:MAG: replication initiation factor domain-containing protein [Bacilli bacterium]|nr:replication initiation factor domain-containing protein [Bacilli bacterium]
MEIKDKVSMTPPTIIIDWFQCTILSVWNDFYEDNSLYKNINIKDVCYMLFEDLFNIDSLELILEFKGISGYTCNISWNNIKMYFHHLYPNQGINIILSGKGCRDFETLNLDWQYFINKLSNYSKVNYNRIDIAIDDYSDIYYDLKKINYYRDSGLVVSRFKSSYNIDHKIIEDVPRDLGRTIQFGSKASNLQITFYNKLLEREHESVIIRDDITVWNRCELRFRHEYAEQIVAMLDKDINRVVKGILHDNIRFVKDKKHTNISRRETCKWWLDYLDNVEKLQLTTKNPEHDITKKRRWLLNTTSKTLLQVLLSNIDTFTLDDNLLTLLLEMLDTGVDKISIKDIELVNNYRTKNNLKPLFIEDIHNLLHDIKTMRVVNEKKKD